MVPTFTTNRLLLMTACFAVAAASFRIGYDVVDYSGLSIVFVFFCIPIFFAAIAGALGALIGRFIVATSIGLLIGEILSAALFAYLFYALSQMSCG